MNAPRLKFSHLGLYVVDVEAIVRFYTEVMGFHITDRGRMGDVPIAFLSQNPLEHHQVVFVGGRAPEALPSVLNQMSFRLDSLGELLALAKRLEGEKVTAWEPVIHGNAWSVYFRDPEGNRVEIFADSDWYIEQPIKEFLDLSLSEAEIREATLAFCREQPGFKPIEQWQDEMRTLMGERAQ